MSKGVVRLILESHHSKWHDSFWISKVMVKLIRLTWHSMSMWKWVTPSKLTQKDPDLFLKYLFKKAKIKNAPPPVPRLARATHQQAPMRASPCEPQTHACPGRSWIPANSCQQNHQFPPNPPRMYTFLKSKQLVEKNINDQRVYSCDLTTRQRVYSCDLTTREPEDGGNSFQLFSTHSPCRWTHSPCLAYVV
jgi:hypothetical protein